MYAVHLREAVTNKVVKLYAAKIIQNAHLREQNEVRRRLNLQREISILTTTDPETSVTLIEVLET